MYSSKFLLTVEKALLYRKASKTAVIRARGQQSLSHSWKDIRRIELALKRLRQGQYGLCTECGVPIAEERLQLIPETPCCIDCAKNQENH